MTTIRKCIESDSQSILDLRNSDNVRTISGNSEVINFEAHHPWFLNKYISADSPNICLVLEADSQFQGYCRLDKIEDGKFEVSIALTEGSRRKSSGSLLLTEAMKLLPSQSEVIATVHVENIQSIKFFNKNGFLEYTESDKFKKMKKTI